MDHVQFRISTYYPLHPFNYFMHTDSISIMSNVQDSTPAGPGKESHSEKGIPSPDNASYHVVSHHATVNELGNVLDPVLNAKIHLVNEVCTAYNPPHNTPG